MGCHFFPSWPVFLCFCLSRFFIPFLLLRLPLVCPLSSGNLSQHSTIFYPCDKGLLGATQIQSSFQQFVRLWLVINEHYISIEKKPSSFANKLSSQSSLQLSVAFRDESRLLIEGSSAAENFHPRIVMTSPHESGLSCELRPDGKLIFSYPCAPHIHDEVCPSPFRHPDLVSVFLFLSPSPLSISLLHLRLFSTESFVIAFDASLILLLALPILLSLFLDSLKFDFHGLFSFVLFFCLFLRSFLSALANCLA